MSRHEREFDPAAPLSVESALRIRRLAGPARRRAAVASLLSAGDGWKDASLRLGGAFADPTGLTGGKEE